MTGRRIEQKTLDLMILSPVELISTNILAASGAYLDGTAPAASGGSTWPTPEYISFQTSASTSEESQWAILFNMPMDYVEGTDVSFEMSAQVNNLATPAHTENLEVSVLEGNQVTSNSLVNDGPQSMSTGYNLYNHHGTFAGNVRPGQLVTVGIFITHLNTSGGGNCRTQITDLRMRYNAWV